MAKSVILWIYLTYCCYFLQSVCTGITYTSKACYGSGRHCIWHDINCSDTQKIAIVDAYFTNNTECGQLGLVDCNTVNPDSVTERGYHRFSTNEVFSLYKNCSRKPRCQYRAPRRVEALTFSVVKYRCIEKLDLPRINARGDVLLSKGDRVMSNCTIQNNNYVCTFKSVDQTCSLSMYALDGILREECLAQLYVLPGNNITMTNCSTVFEPCERLNLTTELPIYLNLPQQSSVWLLINDPFSMGCDTEDLTTTKSTTALKTRDVDSTRTKDTHKAGQTTNNTGAIAGGVVATVLVVLIVTLVSVWIIRQRRAKKELKEKEKTPPIDAKHDMTYSLAGKIPQNNYHEIQELRTQNSDYDYATADGMVLPPTTNTNFTIEPAGKLTARDNTIVSEAECDYDHIGDKPSPQTSDYDTTTSVAQPGHIGEEDYGYNHFQKKVNTQTHQNDYDTAASASKAVAQISSTERNTDEDDYDHFHRGTNASETVSSPYDTTSGVEDNSDYSVAGHMK